MLKSLHAFCQGDGISWKILRFLYSFAHNNSRIADNSGEAFNVDIFAEFFNERFFSPNGTLKIKTV